MQSPPPWLTKLKAAELHKLAVRIGTPCSGTKAVQIQGIENALSSLQTTGTVTGARNSMNYRDVSLISIDMGIRNLAYSHWTTQLLRPTAKEPAHFAQPILRAWRKIDISSGTSSHATNEGFDTGATVLMDSDGETFTGRAKVKESFEPLDYASRAFDFVKAVMDEHRPSRVLIERQRFRSGGGSAVQEWTIRVGVFEGMLHAVLKTLAELNPKHAGLSVESVLPARVNRYWLQDLADSELKTGGAKVKMSARDVKQAKISLVGKLLQDIAGQSPQRLFTMDEGVADVVSTFVGKGTASGNRGTKATSKRQMISEISKLDDLADCLLQGLTWLRWQNNRLQLEAHKQDAYALMT